MYFDGLPKIVYNLGGEAQTERAVTNLLTSIRRRHNAFGNDYMLFERMFVADGDTPEIVAHKYYGHTKWWWVVCLVNNIVKPSMWPLSDHDLTRTIERKYGKKKHSLAYYMRDGVPSQKKFRREFTDGDGNVINHHERGEGLGAERFGMVSTRGTPVTWEEDAIMKNEMKRDIELLGKQYLDDFVSDYKRLIGGRAHDGEVQF